MKKYSVGIRSEHLGLAIALIAVVLVQTRALLRQWPGRTFAESMPTMHEPAWKRAAYYLGGQRFADYISFVRVTTPPNARIVLPPNDPNMPEAHVGLMQYFLFPRDIHNCGADEVEDCVRRIVGPNS